LEAQLDVLATCGIRPKPGVTVDDLLCTFDREKYEKVPYIVLLCIPGSESEHDLTTFLSDNVWHLDTECIEDQGSYAHVAYRMTDLAGGALLVSDVRDHVDIENGMAWLSFSLNGEEIKWDARVQDDWIDPTILTKFARLLYEQKTGLRFTYLDLKGQDCIIGCSTEAQRRELRKRTGLSFEWLT